MAFSTFERSQSKAKLSSVSMRYRFQAIFLTIAPPEQDYISLLKLSIIRQHKIYNKCSITSTKKDESK